MFPTGPTTANLCDINCRGFKAFSECLIGFGTDANETDVVSAESIVVTGFATL